MSPIFWKLWGTGFAWLTGREYHPKECNFLHTHKELFICYHNLNGFQGLRPTIPKSTHPKFVQLLEKSWQQDPTLRPDFSEIIESLQQLAKEV